MKTYTQTSIGKDALALLNELAKEEDRSMRKMLDKIVREYYKKKKMEE